MAAKSWETTFRVCDIVRLLNHYTSKLVCVPAYKSAHIVGTSGGSHAVLVSGKVKVPMASGGGGGGGGISETSFLPLWMSPCAILPATAAASWP